MNTALSHIPNRPLPFGRYRGHSVRAIAARDLQYLIWFATLPKVRADPKLWPCVRGCIMMKFQEEIELAGLDLV